MKSAAIQSLLTDVYELEHKHKITNDSEIYQALSVSLTALLRLLDKAHLKYKNLLMRSIHEHGDKCRSYLARSIRVKQAKLDIDKIKGTNGILVHSSEQIGFSYLLFFLI